MKRIAIVQTSPEFGNVAKNIAEAAEIVGSVEADLYVLPELFATGYNFVNKKELEKLAEPADGATFKAMSALASKLKAHIVYGFPERSGNLYNSAALAGPKGMAGLFRKVHLFAKETVLFSPGDLGFRVFDLPVGKIGLMICFDWYFPESARTLALRGAQIIAHPSNLVMPHCPEAMIVRCLENKVYAATANRTGAEDRGGLDLQFIGTSEIVSPSGEILVRMGRDETGIRVVEVDLKEASNKKINRYNDLIAGRRPSEYQA